MKKLVVLLVMLVLCSLAAWWLTTTADADLKPSASREKLLDKLDVNAVKKLRISEKQKTGDKEETKIVTLALVGDTWTVTERSGYPAAYEKLARLIVDLADQKIAKQKTLGEDAWPDLKLKSPADGDSEKAGLQIELFGEGDKPLHTLVLGKPVSSSVAGRDANPYGGGSNERFARVSGDTNAIWTIANQFYDAQPRVEDWIEKSFPAIAQVKEVDVTAPNAADSWKVSRKDETADFVLAGQKADEDFDATKANAANVLSGASITDVVPKEKVTPDFMKDAFTAKITSFDGFSYNVKALKKGANSDEKHYISLSVAGNFPKERVPEKDEKPDDKKKRDEDFANNLKTKNERLANEKKLEGWVFEISGSSLGSLIKKRSEIMKDKPAPAPGAEPGAPKVDLGLPKTGNAPQPPEPPKPAARPAATTPPPAAKPKTPITVTTPPISVPPAPTPPKPELKAPATDPLPTKPADAPKAPDAKPTEAPKPADAPKAPDAKPAEAPKPSEPAKQPS